MAGIMLKLNRILLFASMFFLLGSISFTQEKSTALTGKKEAQKLWDALVKSKGGQERLHSITNVLSEYSTVTKLDVFPNKMWQFSGPFYGNSYLLIYDADKSRTSLLLATQQDDSEVRNHSYSDIALERVIWLLETKYDKPELLGVRRKKEGKLTFDIIEARIGNFRLGFAFEPEEMLIRRVYFYDEKGVMWQVYAMNDYKLVNGIQMPQKWDKKSVYDKNAEKFDFTPIKFTFNVEYDPKIFDLPSKATTADAWKIKSKL